MATTIAGCSNKPIGPARRRRPWCHGPTTGRVLEVITDEPGLQFYTGNFLDGSITGKKGWNYKYRSAFCMEPEHYPDSPNQPEFPSVVLKPGQTYKNTIIFKFSVQK